MVFSHFCHVHKHKNSRIFCFLSLVLIGQSFFSPFFSKGWNYLGDILIFSFPLLFKRLHLLEYIPFWKKATSCCVSMFVVKQHCLVSFFWTYTDWLSSCVAGWSVRRRKSRERSAQGNHSSSSRCPAKRGSRPTRPSTPWKQPCRATTPKTWRAISTGEKDDVLQSSALGQIEVHPYLGTAVEMRYVSTIGAGASCALRLLWSTFSICLTYIL